MLRSRSSRLALILLPLASFAACKSWNEVPAPSPTGPVRQIEGDVRLQMRNGARIAMHNVTFEKDSVIGLYPGDTTRRALPVSEVLEVEQKSVSTPRTTLLVVGLTAAVLFTVSLLALAAIPPGY